MTADQQLRYQQNLTGRRLAILVLSTNRWPKVKAKTAEIIAASQTSRPGDYVELTLQLFESKAGEFDSIEQLAKADTALGQGTEGGGTYDLVAAVGNARSPAMYDASTGLSLRRIASNTS